MDVILMLAITSTPLTLTELPARDFILSLSALYWTMKPRGESMIIPAKEKTKEKKHLIRDQIRKRNYTILVRLAVKRV
jgi:hypothetical protein